MLLCAQWIIFNSLVYYFVLAYMNLNLLPFIGLVGIEPLHHFLKSAGSLIIFKNLPLEYILQDIT